MLTASALSHVGCVRTHNEDNFAVLPESGLWVVADGMGGHDAGDVASGMIVDEMASLGVAVSAGDQRARFLSRLDRANQRILGYAAANGLATVGATVVALMIHDAELSCAWAGDSRAYLLRDGALTPLTRDHSEIGALVEEGAITEAEARNSPRRHVITRAIGISPAMAPEIVTGVVRPGDRFLLCSDGLTEHLGDADLAAILGRAQPADDIVAALIDLTLARGARDNVTAVVVDCPAEAEAGACSGVEDG